MKGSSFAVVSILVLFCLHPALGIKDDSVENRENSRGIFGGSIIGNQVVRSCNCKCGLEIKYKGLRPRFIGGIIADAHSLPWMALIIVKGVIVAGGALLSDRHVITAATPLVGIATSDVKVTLGAHDRCIMDDSGNYSISAITMHPNYYAVTFAHDLALLRLSAFVSFDYKISPICLPSPVFYYKSQQLVLSGWSDFNTTSCSLKRITLPLLTDTECSASVTTPIIKTPDKGCLGLYGSNGIVCAGDVGNPVQFKNRKQFELFGIIPSGNVCLVANSTIFIKIHEHLSWIKQHIRLDCSCMKF